MLGQRWPADVNLSCFDVVHFFYDRVRTTEANEAFGQSRLITNEPGPKISRERVIEFGVRRSARIEQYVNLDRKEPEVDGEFRPRGLFFGDVLFSWASCFFLN